MRPAAQEGRGNRHGEGADADAAGPSTAASASLEGAFGSSQAATIAVGADGETGRASHGLLRRRKI